MTAAGDVWSPPLVSRVEDPARTGEYPATAVMGTLGAGHEFSGMTFCCDVCGLSRSSHGDDVTTVDGVERVHSSWADLIRDAVEAAPPGHLVHVDVRITVEPVEGG